MCRIVHIICANLILTAFAAPSEKFQDAVKQNLAEKRLVDTSTKDLLPLTSPDSNSRHKRWYDIFDGPVFGPRFGFDEDRPEEDLLLVHKRLRDVLTSVRQGSFSPPPYPPPIPVLVPVLVIPSNDCKCEHTENTDLSNLKSLGDLTENNANETSNMQLNVTSPMENKTNLDDVLRNWGFAVDDEELEDESYNGRELSFVPVPPPRPESRPPPPVDHGSNQASNNIGNENIVQESNSEQNIENTAQLASTSNTDSTNKESSQDSSNKNDNHNSEDEFEPSACDNAILSCCHKASWSFDCFTEQGCTDYDGEDPCNPQSILEVINKIQKVYAAKAAAAQRAKSNKSPTTTSTM